MLTFDAAGLVPAIIQDASSGEVLMLAYMNAQALHLTRTTGITHFWSRSRGRLWQKGEDSGHLQEVVAIYVNCEENSLLIQVRQRGPGACHKGYRSCYYREWRPDGSLVPIMPPAFDPAAAYSMSNPTHRPGANGEAALGKNTTHNQSSPQCPSLHHKVASSPGGEAELEILFRQLYQIYEYLRDEDLTAVSATSRALHAADLPWLMQRALDELNELHGVLMGTHRHTADKAADIVLEGYQACYWLCLMAIAARLPYDRVEPHRHVLCGYTSPNLPASGNTDPFITTITTGFARVGAACRQSGVHPTALLERDLSELRSRPYLAAFWQAEHKEQ
jgi:phosphoribosyl-AMP cyclohydrolase